MSGMRRLKLLVAIGLIMGVSLVGETAGAAEWTAQDAVDRLGRAISFGNALESPNFEGEWGMVIEDHFFSLVSDAGFDSVRLPIRWETRAQADDPWVIDSEFFERIDALVDLAITNDLAVIIDFHHFEDLYSDPAGNTDRFVALWQQIAIRYADAPNTVFFELQNEPHGNLTTEVWNGILAAALDAIRQTNPDRMVIVGGGSWNSAWELQNLDLPDDPALIGTFHNYEPFAFTHQGAEWVSGSDAWLGTTWEGRPEDTDPILAAMDTAQAWSESTGIPILMGEFGAYERANQASRVLYTTYVRQQAELRGFAWAYWEFGAGFGIYDRETGSWREDLLAALVPVDDADTDRFSDDDGSVFEADIEWLASTGITRGCNPPSNDRFCPDDPVTRGQMAAFLKRALEAELVPGEPQEFTDDDESLFEADIEWLASTGITRGCNPPSNDRFCPGDQVTRGQMAAFLVRALDLQLDPSPAGFSDTEGVFAGDIDRLAAAGITVGCNPPTNDRFCPDDSVNRGQMAAFLRRALQPGGV